MHVNSLNLFRFHTTLSWWTQSINVRDGWWLLTLLFTKSQAYCFSDRRVSVFKFAVTVSRIKPNWNKNVTSFSSMIWNTSYHDLTSYRNGYSLLKLIIKSSDHLLAGHTHGLSLCVKGFRWCTYSEILRFASAACAAFHDIIRVFIFLGDFNLQRTG